jgi:hypothetical protein
MAIAEDSEFVGRQLKLIILRIDDWRKGRRSLNSVLGDFMALSAAMDSAEWSQLTQAIFLRLEEANAMNIVESIPLNPSEIEREMQLLELAVSNFAESSGLSANEEF